MTEIKDQLLVLLTNGFDDKDEVTLDEIMSY